MTGGCPTGVRRDTPKRRDTPLTQITFVASRTPSGAREVHFLAPRAARPTAPREPHYAASQAVSEARGSMVHERPGQFLCSAPFGLNHNMS